MHALRNARSLGECLAIQGLAECITDTLYWLVPHSLAYDHRMERCRQMKRVITAKVIDEHGRRFASLECY